METTFDPSPESALQSLQNKITTLEAIELTVLGFMLCGLLVNNSTQSPDFAVLFILLAMCEGFLFGSWAIYNAFIRFARAAGGRVDFKLRFKAAVWTGTYTLWAWLILDLNRFILAKLFYRGEAPIEYAWSARSKQTYREWEQAQKAAFV